MQPGSGGHTAFAPQAALSVMVMVVMVMIKVVVVMMIMGCECRAGKRHQEQYGSKNFLHGKNVSRARRWRKSPEATCIKKGTGALSRSAVRRRA